MKPRSQSVMLAGIIAIAGMSGSSALAQDQAAPPLIKQLNNGNWLPQNEAESLRDELFYQRAIRRASLLQRFSRRASHRNIQSVDPYDKPVRSGPLL
jgi:hypothetical protein